MHFGIVLECTHPYLRAYKSRANAYVMLTSASTASTAVDDAADRQQSLDTAAQIRKYITDLHSLAYSKQILNLLASARISKQLPIKGQGKNKIASTVACLGNESLHKYLYVHIYILASLADYHSHGREYAPIAYSSSRSRSGIGNGNDNGEAR